MPLSQQSPIHCFISAFQHTVQTASLANTSPHNLSCLVEEPWKPVFWAECAMVVQALLAEKQLLKGSFTMSEWLNLRAVTISSKSYTITIPHFQTRSLEWKWIGTTASLKFVLMQDLPYSSPHVDTVACIPWPPYVT